jgi:hypothetical protein
MFSQVQIVNLGLSKIASSRISRLDPPQSSLERFVAAGYDHWKRSEISKRRWVFALEHNYALAKVEELVGVERPYKYSLPVDCLRPVREKRTEWAQRRRYVYSAEDGLKITYVANVDETEFDPLFVEVLACRVAMESVEYVTQSNTKKADAKALYDEAVTEAAKNNAFVIGPEDITSDDEDFPFLTARY